MIKKSFHGILAGTVLFSSLALTPDLAKASEQSAQTNEKDQLINKNDFLNVTVNVDELKAVGLTQEEMDLVLSSTPASGIYLISGVAYDENGNILEVRERGKLSWAVKGKRFLPTVIVVESIASSSFFKERERLAERFNRLTIVEKICFRI
ncbi:hypothetical protein [Lysinibacillus sp. NPDC093688]|uniref:hypothetical protein n=1 Tax=Lysinibacillus sp. NPDC093688 TaxID=3390577 RepID=UPI003CFF695E